MKSTGSEALSPHGPVNFVLMAVQGEPTLPAGPMLRRLKKRGDKAALCQKLGISPQVLSNWVTRGVPKARVTDVANALRMTTERYYFEAGRPLEGLQRTQGELDSSMLVSDFEALPAGLRAVIARKASELREHWDSVPDHLKALFSSQPPADPAHYRTWELSIERALVEMTKPKPKE